MELEVGKILTGKVTGITKFGAFVSLGNDKSGLVHISEVANTFVSDVSQHLSIGQEVKVKVIGIDGTKINLSIKKAVEQPAAEPKPRPAEIKPVENTEKDMSFEDKLKKFMQASDSKMAEIKHSTERRTSRRRNSR